MDLNVSPLPEEDEDVLGRRAEQACMHTCQMESAVDIARRERDERRHRLKRERTDDCMAQVSRPLASEGVQQPRNLKKFDRNKIPPGWMGCPSTGQDIFGILIPSKVPLSESFNDHIPPGKRYSFRQVTHQQRILGRTLGLVIDLTNTSRYYHPSDIKNEGIKYVKIQCKGRDSVPDTESVNFFVHEVLQFNMRQRPPVKKFILVHCTHGHNRTGFMIVHYLMRTMPISVTHAIKIFADARPPGIYKPDYVDALYAFYHERKPDMVTCPETPEWKRASDLDLNGEAVPDDDDDDNNDGNGSAITDQDNQSPDVPLTNDDVLGDAIPCDQQDMFRQFCFQMLFKSTAKGKPHFPGSHPVSLDKENLQLLRQRYYYATWKADGTRYMMLITMDGCYLIDRNFNFRRVQMRFPCRGATDPATGEKILSDKAHHFTLLDGEMIIDTLPDTNAQARRYLVYDMIAVNQVSVVDRPFYERWKMVEREVIEARNIEKQCIYQSRNPYYRYDLEPFRVRRKDFYLLSTVTRLLNEFIPRLSHAADGLIFQGWDDAYVPRTHAGLLKWKYANMNSVDFLFEVSEDGRQMLFLFERGKKKSMNGDRVVFRDSSDPSSYSGKIVECSWDKEEGVWMCMRVRTDKAAPNEFNTYRKVMRSIHDNITGEILLSEISEIIQLPMYRDRIKSDSKALRQRS